MSNTSLVCTNYKVENARNFIDSVNQNQIYLFAASPTPWFAGVVPQPYDDIQTTVIDPFRNMLFGKYIGSNDVIQVIPNYQYTPSTVYAMYDDADPLIFTKKFYAIVNATSYFHVFKCLDNMGGLPSTIPPNFADIDASDDSYKTSDGYTWKYMYSVDSATASKFSTSSWFPLVSNSAVQSSAVPGSIDIIQTISGGNGYSNYLNGVFTVNDIRLNGNDYTYAVNAHGSPFANFYNDCLIYIAADPYGNAAGEYSKIINYAVNSTTKWIQLETPFQNVPQNGAQYLIYPSVFIQGSGVETNTAVAWAVVNALTNCIAYTQVLYSGSGYQYASAKVNASSVVGVTMPANLYAIYSPPGGHGAHLDRELGGTAVCLSGLFHQTESNTIFANCHYQQIGLVKNPSFANVEVHFATDSSLFIVGETLNDIEIINLQATGQTTAGFTSVIASDADFLNQLNVGDDILIYDGVNYQFNQVNSVTNSSSITLANGAPSTTSALSIFLANVVASGTIIDVSAGIINVDQVTAPININDYIIGSASGSFAQVSAVFRSGNQKNFNTFVATSQYTGTVLTGSFEVNEQVTDINQLLVPANGWFCAISQDHSVVYLTNNYGIVQAGDVLKGVSSGATFAVSDCWQPEINFESGEILYLENFSNIDRSVASSEVFKLVMTF